MARTRPECAGGLPEDDLTEARCCMCSNFVAVPGDNESLEVTTPLYSNTNDLSQNDPSQAHHAAACWPSSGIFEPVRSSITSNPLALHLEGNIPLEISPFVPWILIPGVTVFRASLGEWKAPGWRHSRGFFIQVFINALKLDISKLHFEGSTASIFPDKIR
ncbi:hypothetical protein BDN72DRAFT_865926 [Pluteus cervinus]|uniref:Uncharacterized protein n=1 Tax=Pluteus cervinus TaxID=181527 RepID=A0ACD2ZYE0_9AGAR|nr:hypothetical protein BDN72DRAFT_865926 [Pluteus cervinus]